MEYVQLGRTGLQVPRLILGGAGFGDVTDKATATRLIEAAFSRGVNAFDTSNVYNGGLSEEFIGEALARRRDRAIILTKVGFRTEADYDEMAMILRLGGLTPEALAQRQIAPSDFGLSRRNIMRSVEASLRRLRTDYIDVLQLHFWDPTTSVDETLAALSDLVRQGKVCYVGCSGVTGEQLGTLSTTSTNAAEGMQAVQVSLNLLTPYRDPTFPDVAARAGVSVLAFGALAAGFFGKRFDPAEVPDASTRFGSRQGNVDRFWTKENHDYVARLDKLARELGRSVVELAQGFVYAQPGVTAVIAGADDEAQLDERVRAVGSPLSPEEMGLLRDL